MPYFSPSGGKSPSRAEIHTSPTLKMSQSETLFARKCVTFGHSEPKMTRNVTFRVSMAVALDPILGINLTSQDPSATVLGYLSREPGQVQNGSRTLFSRKFTTFARKSDIFRSEDVILAFRGLYFHFFPLFSPRREVCTPGSRGEQDSQTPSPYPLRPLPE